MSFVQTRLVLVLDFTSSSTGNEGESIWKVTGIGERDWLESFVFISFRFCIYFFCFPFKIKFLI